MPNRIIRDTCRSSATLYKLSDGAERLFWRLVTMADDFGRFEADPQVIKSVCFPLWPDKRLPVARIARLYGELEAELVTTYAINGKRYGHFNTWERHQDRRAKTSKYPDPTPASICAHMPAHVPVSESVSEDRIRDTIPPPSNGVAEPSWGTPEDLVALYNRLAPETLPRVTRISPARRDKAKRYLAMFPEATFWTRVFSELRLSAFLQGLSKRPGHESFRGDFDWLLTKGKDGTENAVKVAEGKYADEASR